MPSKVIKAQSFSQTSPSIIAILGIKSLLKTSDQGQRLISLKRRFGRSQLSLTLVYLKETVYSGQEFLKNVCCVKTYLEHLNFMVIKLSKIYYWWKYTC